MSAYRVPADTAAGGFGTLIVLMPWEVCQAAGMHEEPSAYLRRAAARDAVQGTRAPPHEMRVGGEGRRGAGTQGDALKALQALPELARAGAGSGEVIAWGSTPRESKLYIDGVEVPSVYHGSGIRSVLPSGWVSRFTLLPGAYGVEYGRGLGGVVAVETRPLDTERWHGGVHADLLDAHVTPSEACLPVSQ